MAEYGTRTSKQRVAVLPCTAARKNSLLRCSRGWRLSLDRTTHSVHHLDYSWVVLPQRGQQNRDYEIRDGC